MQRNGTMLGLSGTYKNETIDIPSDEEIYIGRDAASAHIIMDKETETISRRHCGIQYNAEDQTYSVTDYSKNGTFREDGSRLPYSVQVTLPRGTVIILGTRQAASFALM